MASVQNLRNIERISHHLAVTASRCVATFGLFGVSKWLPLEIKAPPVLSTHHSGTWNPFSFLRKWGSKVYASPSCAVIDVWEPLRTWGNIPWDQCDECTFIPCMSTYNTMMQIFSWLQYIFIFFWLNPIFVVDICEQTFILAGQLICTYIYIYTL